jgi:seryl-tRNA synthetase
MIDVNDIRRRPEAYKQAIRDKRIGEIDVDALLEWDDRRKLVQTEVDELRRERNTLAAATQTVAENQRAQHLAKARELGIELNAKEGELRTVQEWLTQLALRIPSITAAGVPFGVTDSDNVEIRRWGDLPDPPPQRDHIELARKLGLANFDDAREFAGSRAFALTGNGALLEMALMRFAIDHLAAKGFMPIVPPLMVKDAAMIGTGYFPIGAENAYALERDELFLVGTAEVPLVAMHANKTYKAEQLPLRFAGVSTCFRREAGAAGKDTRGLYRVHQFQKVEQIVITTNDGEQTARMHAQLLQNAEELLQALELPYRIVAVCTGDMGLGQVQKHDIETWMPGRQAYGETHSCSTMNDFQARRLNIRYTDDAGKKRYVHTLNNTAIASPRILIPLLENHQRPDGSIYIPPALRPYMGGKEYIH